MGTYFTHCTVPNRHNDLLSWSDWLNGLLVIVKVKVLFPVKLDILQTYKPWGYISSQGVLGGVINGGTYIRRKTGRGTYKRQFAVPCYEYTLVLLFH